MNEPPKDACQCGGSVFWRGKIAGSDWYCMTCTPPVVQSMVGDQVSVGSAGASGGAGGVVGATGGVVGASGAGAAGTVRRLTPFVRMYATDRCSRCNGQFVVDTVRCDGSWEVRCWSCKTLRSSG